MATRAYRPGDKVRIVLSMEFCDCRECNGKKARGELLTVAEHKVSEGYVYMLDHCCPMHPDWIELVEPVEQTV